MKVSDVIQKQVDYVTTETTVKDVARLIFGRNIGGVPVCEGKKIVGFITERDILRKFYPSMQEYIEDSVHARDFEAMEKNVSEILSLPAEKIMNKEVLTIEAENPIMRAQSTMLVYRISRLPVVDKNGNLIGIVTQDDIFRSVVGGELQFVEDEEYHDWLSRHYDTVVQWEKRLGHEIPDLVALFRKEKIRKILDIGAGTGEHAIALAKEGFEVVALERSKLMHEASKKKWLKLSANLKRKVTFLHGEYAEILKNKSRQLDAAIFMGNALPHNPHNYKKVLEAVSKSLVSKNSIIVIQTINFEKVFKVNSRLLDFNVAQLKNDAGKEYVFVEFYDPPRKSNDYITLNMVIFYFDGKRWFPKAFNNTPLVHIHKENIEPILHKLGFNNIAFYGGMLLGKLFQDSFKSTESDWLNVVAKR